MTTVSHGKPYAGNPHVRFEEGDSASAEPRRKSLLHKKSLCLLLFYVLVVGFLNWAYVWCSDDCIYNLAKCGERYCRFADVFFCTFPFGYRPMCLAWTSVFACCYPKWVWNIVNTTFALGFVLLLIRAARRRLDLSFESVAWTVSIVFLLLFRGESFVWGAGATDYLWTGCATLAFLIIHRKIEEDALISWMGIVALSIFSFFVGWMQESFSLPVLFGLGAWYLPRLKKLNAKKVCVYGSYAIGAFVLTLGAASRCSAVPSFSFVGFVITVAKIVCALKCVWILALVLAVRRDRATICQRNILELLVILGSVSLILSVGFNGERCLFVSNMMAAIILIREIRLPRLFCCIGIGLMIVVSAALIPLALQIRANMIEFIAGYLQSPTGVAVHERVNCGPLSRYFYQCVYQWQAEPNGHARFMADFYGKPGMPIALSRNLYENLYLKDRFCVVTNRMPIDKLLLYSAPSENAIVMPLSEIDLKFNDMNQVDVHVQYSKMPLVETIKSLIVRSIMPGPPRSSVGQALKTAHGDYLLIPKVPYSDRYISDVTIGSQGSHEQ